MAKQWLLIPMMMTLGTGVAVEHGLEQKASMMPIDTCVRACLACDQGNVISCAICELCTEPALTAR